MNKAIVILAALSAAVFSAMKADAQVAPLEDLLRSVEANNLTLRAERHATDGRASEARTGNSLEPLSVGYSSVWDSPASVGKAGELEVSQEFDLPMVYAARGAAARARTRMYESEYLAVRQGILLEAEETYLELCALARVVELSEPRLRATAHLDSLYGERYATGDVTAIDRNRARFEYVVLREGLSSVDRRIIELRQKLATLNGGIEPQVEFVMPPAEELAPLDVLLADWEQLSPEIEASRLREAAASHDVRVSRRQALPKVEIGYKYEYGPGERAGGVTAGLSIPILSNRFNVRRARSEEAAAAAEREALEAERRGAVTELYDKALYTAGLLAEFGTLPPAGEWSAQLERTLKAGQIDLVDYYSELESFYSALEASVQVALEYALLSARLNAVYL